MLISDFKNWISLSRKNNKKYCKARDKLNKIEKLNNKYVLFKNDVGPAYSFIFLIGLALCGLSLINKMFFVISCFYVIFFCFYFIIKSYFFVSDKYFKFKLYLIKKKKERLESVFHVFKDKNDIYIKILENLSIFENKDLSYVERALYLMKAAKKREYKEKQIEIEKAKEIARQKELDNIKAKKEKAEIASKKAKEEALRNNRIIQIQKEHNFVKEN